MNKILFSLLLVGVAFNGIQEASAVKILTEKQPSTVFKRPLPINRVERPASGHRKQGESVCRLITNNGHIQSVHVYPEYEPKSKNTKIEIQSNPPFKARKRKLPDFRLNQNIESPLVVTFQIHNNKISVKKGDQMIQIIPQKGVPLGQGRIIPAQSTLK